MTDNSNSIIYYPNHSNYISELYCFTENKNICYKFCF